MGECIVDRVVANAEVGSVRTVVCAHRKAVAEHSPIQHVYRSLGMQFVSGIVRDHADRRSLFVQGAEELHHGGTIRRVQVSRRFVGQQYHRLAGHGARDGHALLLATGQLRREVRGPVTHCHTIECVVDSPPPLRFAHATVEQRKLHIFVRCEVANQVERMEDESDLAVANARALLVPHGGQMVTVVPRSAGILRDAALPSARREVYRMAMPATINDWTVDMLDALPNDGQRYEIIDGELFVTPGPAEFHQDIAGELYALLREYLKGHGIGKAMISPADVRRGDRTRNRVQPDVFVVGRTEGKRPEYPYELHELLLAVEVASPSNPRLDYHVKRDLYLRERVGEYWVINPDALNISRWRGHDDPGEVFSKRIAWQPEGMPTAFVLNLAEFFADARS